MNIRLLNTQKRLLITAHWRKSFLLFILRAKCSFHVQPSSILSTVGKSKKAQRQAATRCGWQPCHGSVIDRWVIELQGKKYQGHGSITKRPVSNQITECGNDGTYYTDSWERMEGVKLFRTFEPSLVTSDKFVTQQMTTKNSNKFQHEIYTLPFHNCLAII